MANNIPAGPAIQPASQPRNQYLPKKDTAAKWVVGCTGTASTSIAIALTPPIIPPCCGAVIGCILTTSALCAIDKYMPRRHPAAQAEIPIVPAILIEDAPCTVVETNIIATVMPPVKVTYKIILDAPPCNAPS